MPYDSATDRCDSWLAFELSVLRRAQFRSVAFPWSDTHHACAVALKRTGVRVHVNCASADAFCAGVARVEYNDGHLGDDDLTRLTAEAYTPGNRPRLPELRQWFDEPEAWWLENLRTRVETLETRHARAAASDLVIRAGDYALAFDDETRHLRLTLTDAMRRMARRSQPEADGRGGGAGDDERNETRRTTRRGDTCRRQPPGEFLAEQQVDLAFIRLPRRAALCALPRPRWSDAWLRAGEFDAGASNGREMPREPSKAQYLGFLEELLTRAAHLPQWAILHAADGFLSSEELVETIRHVRPVKTIYTKDFAEWMGARASIIMA